VLTEVIIDAILEVIDRMFKTQKQTTRIHMRIPDTEEVAIRSAIASLLAEVIPSETIVWRCGDTYTAAQLRQQVEDESPIGQQYASDLLRVSRDFLLRMANRKDAR